MMIHLKNINKSYMRVHNPLHVLKDVNLEIQKGEFIAITGSSGSGKSTLLNILGFLDTFDSGNYILSGKVMKHMTETQASHYRSRYFGFVFQAFNLIGYKSAIENVALPLYYQRVGRKERNALALEYLERLGLKEWAHHKPGELSGGQNQRVAIARALITQPKVILADEPTGALDSENSNTIMQQFDMINQMGITIIVVTHEQDIAQKAQRIIHIKDGRIVNSEDN